LCHPPKHFAGSFHTDDSIKEVLQQLGAGEATPQPPVIRNRGYGRASKKLKNVEYCAEQKITDLVEVGM